MKKTKFLFDTPLTKDWLFYIFLFFLASNVFNGASNVVESGGPVLTSAGIISGLLDGAFRVFLSWFPVIPLIYLVRKVIRSRKRPQQETA
jgi:hypothetical protein